MRSTRPSTPNPAARALKYWHLLSLDAPTVAALWAWFFARALGLRLAPLVPALLALATWIFYVADRMLDGLSPSPALRERHRFYQRHRRPFLAACALAALLLVWLVATRMPAAALRDDGILAAFALLYLLLVHARVLGWSRALPKEAAVGVIFAAATAVPVWTHRVPDRGWLGLGVGLFALLCWLNCVAIHAWERDPGDAIREARPRFAAHALTHWSGDHLPLVAAALGSAALLAALLARPQGLAAVPLAVVASAALFALLHRWRHRLTTLQLRIAADAALLTPFLFFLVR